MQELQIPDVESSILEFLNNQSSLVVHRASLNNSTLICYSPSSLTFTSTLIYSSDDGFPTASDLINLMAAQVMSGKGTIHLTVKGVELPIRQVGNDAQTDSISIPTALFFGGVGVSSLILIPVVIILIL